MSGLPTITGGRLGIALAALVAVGVLAGCGRETAKPQVMSLDEPVGGEYAAEAPGEPMAAAAERVMDGAQISATGDTESALSLIAAAEAAEGRKVIKTAELDVEVENLDDAQKQVVAMVDRLGGFISSLTVSDYTTSRVSEIVARVPSEHFREVYDAVKALGKVERDHIGGQDVTEEFMDLERRIANKQAEEERVREMFKQATTVEDLLKVEQRLSEVRMEIEGYQGRLRFLKDQVKYSTLTITLTEYGEAPIEETGGWRLEYHLKGAVRALISAIRAIVVAIIYIAIPGAVVWIPLLIIIALIRNAWRRHKQRRQAAQAPPPPAAEGE